jgi:hypothetical protein
MSDTKKCSKCGEVKGLGEFYRSKTGTHGRHAYCKDCGIAYSKTRQPVAYGANRSREIARAVKWQHENADRYKSRLLEWQNRNRARLLAAKKLDTKRRVDELSDGYVAARIGLRALDAPPELIALKREQLAIKRMARELKKAATQPTGENE